MNQHANQKQLGHCIGDVQHHQCCKLADCWKMKFQLIGIDHFNN
jgi:hypothetical protein